MTLDQLPTSELFSPREAIGADRFPDQQAIFIEQVGHQVKEFGYGIADRRLFVFIGVSPAMGPQWVVIHAELGNQLANTFQGKEVSRAISEGGPAAISIWKLPHGQVIAVAESEDLPDGNALVGYFALTKR